jgi:hypothetical protein
MTEEGINVRLQARISINGRRGSYISLINVNIFVRLELPKAVAIMITILDSRCSVKSHYYATTAREANIRETFLSNDTVNTFP